MSYTIKDKPITTRPGPPKGMRPSIKQALCNHTYKELDTDVEKLYADSGEYLTKVKAIFFCEKCLDVKQRQETFNNERDEV